MTGVGLLIDGVGRTREVLVELDADGQPPRTIHVQRDLPADVERQLALDARVAHEIPMDYVRADFDLLTDPLIERADELPDGRHLYGYRFPEGLPYVRWRLEMPGGYAADTRRRTEDVTQPYDRPIVTLYDETVAFLASHDHAARRVIVGVGRRRT